MALHTVRSERLLCQQLEYNLPFRWILGMELDEVCSQFQRPTLRGAGAGNSREFLRQWSSGCGCAFVVVAANNLSRTTTTCSERTAECPLPHDASGFIPSRCASRSKSAVGPF